MSSENSVHLFPDHIPLQGSSPTSSSSSPAATMTSISTNSADTTTSTSTSAPELQANRSMDAVSVVVSLSADTILMHSSHTTPTESVSGVASPTETSGGPGTPSEPDAQIIEALRSKDRLYVLKLGEQMETLITERRARIDINPATSYQRMLVHRCSTYYKLSPETDSTTKTISVYYRVESRIPARKICELVPAEESAQPAFVIMRRTPQDRRPRQSSQTDSVTGDDEGSEGDESIGGRSNATGSGKRHLTIEEREAAYNEARNRIFMDFQEKDKEKDISANSSTFSLVSGSSISGGRSSFGEIDDSASSAATESELSAQGEKRGGRRGGSTASSSRSLHSGHHAGSRNSRATSPSFTFPSLYDPSGNSFEPTYSGQAPSHGYVPYYPPFQQAGYPPAQPYPSAYPYPYPPYGYPSPQPHRHHSDPASPPGPDSMYGAPQGQPPPMMPPYQPYLWAPGQPSQQMPPAASPSTTAGNLPGTHPQVASPQSMQYPGYFPGAYSGYYPPSQYPAGTGQTISPSHPPHMSGGYYPPEYAQGMDMHTNHNGAAEQSQTSSRSSNGNNNNIIRRGPSRSRQQAWIHPGVPQGGGYYTPTPGPMDTVGPRLSSRRTSSSSVSTGTRTPGDEASSTASSSTTSSSSRKTFISSTSSKHHPLPARPDWAVGLKAQPTLSTRHSDSRTMSPARIGGHLPGQHHSQQSQPPLQSTDFPPLSSAPEKRTPVVGGAWTNSSTVRSVLSPGASASGNALVHYPNSAAGTSPNPNVPGSGMAFMNARLDDQDRFERPPPKGNVELFNPKARPQRSTANGGGAHGSVSKADEGGLVEKMESVYLDGPSTPPASVVASQ